MKTKILTKVLVKFGIPAIIISNEDDTFDINTCKKNAPICFTYFDAYYDLQFPNDNERFTMFNNLIDKLNIRDKVVFCPITKYTDDGYQGDLDILRDFYKNCHCKQLFIFGKQALHILLNKNIDMDYGYININKNFKILYLPDPYDMLGKEGTKFKKITWAWMSKIDYEE